MLQAMGKGDNPVTSPLALLFYYHPDPLLLLDRNGCLLASNPAARNRLGFIYAPEAGNAPAFRDDLLPSARFTWDRHWRRALQGKVTHCRLHIAGRKGAASFVAVATLIPVNERGLVTGVYLLLRDQSHQALLEARLDYFSRRDPLTGLLNRRSMEEALQWECQRALQTGDRGAVVVINIDAFREINHGYGRKAADRALAVLSRVLVDELGDRGKVARLDADEFLVLLPGADDEKARRAAQRLLERIAAAEVRWGCKHFHVTASAGIALYPRDGSAMDQLLTRADLALSRAKQLGLERVEVYSPEKQAVQDRLAWMHLIRKAVTGDGLRLVWQPILDLRADRVSMYEVLVRLYENGALVSPEVFVLYAERYGLIHEIDQWVVEQVIGLLQKTDLHLLVNTSGKSFSHPQFVDGVIRRLSSARVDASRLTFEITETDAIVELSQAQRFVEALKSLGCQVALDDFGVGFSSLKYVRDLAVDYIKIDGSFIKNLRHNAMDQHLVRSIVQVAQGLGIQTVAECVEDQETLEVLRQLGVDYAQGYYIGYPRPIQYPFPRAGSSGW